MSKVMKYPIYPITFSYVSGIFCSYYLKLPDNYAFMLTGFSVIALIILYILQRKNGFNRYLNILTLIAVFCAFSSAGFSSFKFHNKADSTIDLTANIFQVEVTDVLKSNAYSHRIYAKLLQQNSATDVLVSFSNKSNIPKVGDVLQIVGSIQLVSKPKNLYDFNYNKYLELKRIHYQINSYHQPIKIGEEHTLIRYIVDLRSYLLQQFNALGYSDKTQGFIQALLFGNKTNLTDEVHQQFKDFGILHVLAVSGMHVVLLFSTISYALKRMNLSRNTITIVLVVFLILFTLMAGLSGSVVRASLMCLMTIIGSIANRRVHTINLLISSMLIILLFDPNYLFDVGFQLSYLAVFSIVYYYPIVQHYFTFKNVIANYFGQLVGISLVAQLGVLPLSIFYFNQIPLLFLLGNVIAIPLTNFLLCAWFVQMILSLLSVNLVAFFTPIFSWFSNFCFDTLTNLSGLFTSKSVDFELSAIQTILSIIFIFALFWMFREIKIYKIYILGVLILCFQITVFTNLVDLKNSIETIIISDSKKLVLLNRASDQVIQMGYPSKYSQQSIKKYTLHTSSKIVRIDSVINSFSLNGQKWLVIDRLGVYPQERHDVVILYQNSKVNLERLIGYVNPNKIVLHSSNKEYLNTEYASYLDEKKIPYYNMRTKGAYILNYNLGNN